MKMHVFQLLLGIKEKLLHKMMQSNCLCVVLLVKRKKLLIVTVFTWFPVFWKNTRWRPCLVTLQTSSSATTHKIYFILYRRSKAFHWRQKRNKGGVQQPQYPIPPPPPPNCTKVRVWLCLYVRGLCQHITANGEKFGMGLLIIKSTCYSSRMRGAGVSTQQFSSLQGSKISVETKYAI